MFSIEHQHHLFPSISGCRRRPSGSPGTPPAPSSISSGFSCSRGCRRPEPRTAVGTAPSGAR